MGDRVLIDGGRRQGRTFQFEQRFRQAIADGKEPVVLKAGVYFAVSFDDDDVAVYVPFPHRPDGI